MVQYFSLHDCYLIILIPTFADLWAKNTSKELSARPRELCETEN